MDIDTAVWMVCFSGSYAFIYWSYCFITDSDFSVDHFLFSGAVGLASLTSFAGLYYIKDNIQYMSAASISCSVVGALYFQAQSFKWIKWVKGGCKNMESE